MRINKFWLILIAGLVLAAIFKGNMSDSSTSTTSVYAGHAGSGPVYGTHHPHVPVINHHEYTRIRPLPDVPITPPASSLSERPWHRSIAYMDKRFSLPSALLRHLTDFQIPGIVGHDVPDASDVVAPDTLDETPDAPVPNEPVPNEPSTPDEPAES